MVGKYKREIIWKWRHKFVSKIPFHASKPHYFEAIRHFSSPIERPTEISPKNSFPPKSKFPNRSFQNPKPRPTFLNPHIVLTTLRNCTSDLISLSLFLWFARQQDYFHDKHAFHHMVNVVSNLTGKYGRVKRILQELETIGCITKAQTLLLLMRIYWRGEMYDMVLEAFEEMGNYGYIPNTYARNIVIDVSFKIKRVDVALKLLDEIRDPNFLTFSIAVCNLCRLKEVDNVKIVLKRMLIKGFSMNPGTYLQVLNCFCKFGRLDEALQLLGTMIVSGTQVSMNVWSILIDGFCKSGQIDFAAHLRQKMVEIGCSPNIVTGTSLIKGFLESKMPEKAFEIVNTLESKGCFPDLVLCNVLMDGLSKMGRYDNAFEVFSSLKERKLIPDVYTFSSLVSTICLSKQYVHFPLLTSVVSKEPDLVVMNCLLTYACKAGYPKCAVESYNDMIKRGFQPDRYSFVALLSALCRLGKFREAVDVYNGIIQIHPDLNSHVHTVIINSLIKSGQFHLGVELFRKVAAMKFSLDVVSYNAAITGRIRGGFIEEAYNLFKQMEMMGIAPDMKSYYLMLSVFLKVKDGEMIRFMVQEMVEFIRKTAAMKFPLNVFSYISAITGLIRGGFMVEAYKLFKQMEKMGIAPDMKSYNLMLFGFLKAKDGEMIRCMVQEMVEFIRKAAAMKFSLDVGSVNAAITGLIRGGFIEEACNLFKQKEKMGIAPDMKSYNLMLSGFLKAKDGEMIMCMVQEMVDRNIELDKYTYKLMRNSGLVPKEVQDCFLPVDGFDNGGGCSNSLCTSDSRNVLEHYTSSYEDIPEDVACVA